MPFERPTLQQLITRAQTDLETALPGVDARLRRTVENVLVRIVSGMAHGLHGHIAWSARQVIPTTAEGEQLKRWADVFGVEEKSAVASIGPVLLTSADGVVVVPAMTRLRRADGVLYSVDVETDVHGTTPVLVTAVESGSNGDAPEGTPLSLTSPIAGLNSVGWVGEPGLSGGAEREREDELIARIVQRVSHPSRGGGPGDYVAWALESPVATRAWEYPHRNGAGSVVVFFVNDRANPIIPTVPNVQAVQALLEQRAPVNARPVAVAPIAAPMNPIIALSPNNSAMQSAVTAELADLLLKTAPEKVVKLNLIREAIARAGADEYALISPAGDVVPGAAHIVTLGNPTWSAL